MNHNLQKALKQPKFRWFAKHLNHIAENIVFKKRNISFLAINALFRLKDAVVRESPFPFEGSYQIVGFVALQKNDRLRTKAEEMTVMFRVDKKFIIITAFSESDEF